jgi:hypothetical protein
VSGAFAAAPPVNVRVTAPTLSPRANAPWPVSIRVTGAGGKPLAARLTMRILLGTLPIGKVDNGRVWRFVGTWHEPKGQEITWPAASSGQSFVFEAIVTALGRTVRKHVTVHVQ